MIPRETQKDPRRLRDSQTQRDTERTREPQKDTERRREVQGDLESYLGRLNKIYGDSETPRKNERDTE